MQSDRASPSFGFEKALFRDQSTGPLFLTSIGIGRHHIVPISIFFKESPLSETAATPPSGRRSNHDGHVGLAFSSEYNES